MEKLFKEKYRPQTVDETVLPKRLKDIFSQGLQQDILLYGSTGLGKTSIAKVLAAPFPNLYINISDESSVDVLRTKLTDFCSSHTPGATSKMKCVILDEIEGASEQFLKALRPAMERYASTVRFIGITNYVNKLPESNVGRFELINMNCVNKEEEAEVKLSCAKRIRFICQEHGIEIQKEALIEFVEKNFPDIRTMMNKVQSWKIRNLMKIELTDLNKANYIFSDLYEYLLSFDSQYKTYQFIRTNYANGVDDALAAFGNDFPDWLTSNHPEIVNKILPSLIKEVWDHQRSIKQVIDPLITLWSLCFTIQQLIKNNK